MAKKNNDPPNPWFNESAAIGFRGLDAKTKQRLTPQQLKEVKSSDAYTLHKPRRKHFKRRPVIAYGIGDEWQGDLLDMNNVKKDNKNTRFILTVIDVFSRRAWLEPVVRKSGELVAEALRTVIERAGYTPLKLQTDKGTEFYNNHVAAVLKDNNNIKHFSTHSEVKASLAERLNKTIRSIFFKYFTHTNTVKWLDKIRAFEKSYNASFHRSIGRAPNQVTAENEKEVWEFQYRKKLTQTKEKPKLKEGDYVRISNQFSTFGRGYTQQWSREIFKIKQVVEHARPLYKLEDLAGEDILGSFYPEEVQKVDKPEVFRIEKVLRYRGVGKNREALVKWLGYDNKFNSWVLASTIGNGGASDTPK